MVWPVATASSVAPARWLREEHATLPVLCPGCLADFDQVAVWVAQVAADLVITVLGGSEELCAFRAPGMVDGVDVGHADVEGHADGVWVGGGAMVTVGLSPVGPPPTFKTTTPL